MILLGEINASGRCAASLAALTPAVSRAHGRSRPPECRQAVQVLQGGEKFVGSDDDSDERAYKWLLVAADFGHAEAEEWLDTLRESSSLRYDDDQFCTGNAHWELGVAYLAGADGLPRDHARAKAHFNEARARGYPHSVTGSSKMLADARKAGGNDGRAIVDAVYK